MKTIPYTYFIKQRDTGYFYYGVKYSKDANPDTFWVKYFTSSKYVHQLIEKYGANSFDVQIRKTFDKPRAAYKWEQKVLSKIIHWEGCLNISLGGDSQKSHKNRHIKDKNGLSSYDKVALKTAQTRKENGSYKKQSEKMKGMSIGVEYTCSHCGKICYSGNFKRWHGDNCKLNPNISQESLNERNKPNQNRIVSESTKNKLRKINNNRVRAFDIINEKNVRISKEEFYKYKNIKYVGITAKGTPAYKKIFQSNNNDDIIDNNKKDK